MPPVTLRITIRRDCGVTLQISTWTTAITCFSTAGPHSWEHCPLPGCRRQTDHEKSQSLFRRILFQPLPGSGGGRAGWKGLWFLDPHLKSRCCRYREGAWGMETANARKIRKLPPVIIVFRTKPKRFVFWRRPFKCWTLHRWQNITLEICSTIKNSMTGQPPCGRAGIWPTGSKTEPTCRAATCRIWTDRLIIRKLLCSWINKQNTKTGKPHSPYGFPVFYIHFLCRFNALSKKCSDSINSHNHCQNHNGHNQHTLQAFHQRLPCSACQFQHIILKCEYQRAQGSCQHKEHGEVEHPVVLPDSL